LIEGWQIHTPRTGNAPPHFRLAAEPDPVVVTFSSAFVAGKPDLKVVPGASFQHQRGERLQKTRRKVEQGEPALNTH